MPECKTILNASLSLCHSTLGCHAIWCTRDRRRSCHYVRSRLDHPVDLCRAWLHRVRVVPRLSKPLDVFVLPLGISNYMSFEVAEAVMLCLANGWVQPSVYQGIYNAIHRSIGPELLVCLRKYGVAFYEYNALAGDFFTGKHLSEADLEVFLAPPTSSSDSSSNSTMPAPLAHTRFDTTQHGSQARACVSRYWTPQHLRALALVSEAAKPHGLSLTECALRWVSHHSALRREYGDTMVIGASKEEYIKENLTALEAGPLPEDVIKAIDEAYEIVRPQTTKYWH